MCLGNCDIFRNVAFQAGSLLSLPRPWIGCRVHVLKTPVTRGDDVLYKFGPETRKGGLTTDRKGRVFKVDYVKVKRNRSKVG